MGFGARLEPTAKTILLRHQMAEHEAAQAAATTGVGGAISLILTGAGGYFAKHLWDRRKAPRQQGPSTHELLQNLATDVAVIKATMVTEVALRDLVDARFTEHVQRDHSKAA